QESLFLDARNMPAWRLAISGIPSGHASSARDERNAMKPAAFTYHRAHDVADAIALLSELGDEAKILAGGQSLTPMMNFRLARPSALVDVTRVDGLDYIHRDSDGLRIGALTTHRTIETARSPELQHGFAVLSRAAR